MVAIYELPFFSRCGALLTGLMLAALLFALPRGVFAEENKATPPDKYSFSITSPNSGSSSSQNSDKPGFSGMTQEKDSLLMNDFPPPSRGPMLFDTYEDKWYNRM